MFNLYNALKSTSSTNDKISILRNYGENPSVREAVRLCYEPFIHSYMNNVPKPKKTGDLNFYDSFHEFRTLFLDLNDRKITGNAARDKVQLFLESVDKSSQEMYTLILKKDLKAGIAERLVNKAFGDDFVNIFEVQLGQPYNPDRSYKIDKKNDVPYWWCSPKLDGIRGFQEGSDPLRTRNGNKIFGFDHILNEIFDLKDEYNLHIVDGELYKMGLPFQTIASYVNADKNIVQEHKEQIMFHVFAICKRRDWRDTDEMVNFMKKIKWNKYKYLIPIEYIYISNESNQIFNKMNEYFEFGYEGIMLRHPTRTYSKGRSHDIVKVKPSFEGDFRVIGFERGEIGTQFENTLGALVVDGNYTTTSKDKDVIFPIRSNVGGGFKIKPELGVTRDDIWNNKDKWIDTIVEIEFQGITDKPRKDGTYSLRFPRFKRQRVDRRL